MDVPLLVRHPELVGAEEKVDEYVYNHDLFATVCQLAGVEHGLKVDGINVFDYVEREFAGSGRSHVTSGFGYYVMYRDDEYWFISDREGKEAQLYDLKVDPKLQKNIARECPELVEKFYRKIVEDAGGCLPKLEPISLEAYVWYEQLYL
jgi:arylsulfatase A-like enzyme